MKALKKVMRAIKKNLDNGGNMCYTWNREGVHYMACKHCGKLCEDPHTQEEDVLSCPVCKAEIYYGECACSYCDTCKNVLLPEEKADDQCSGCLAKEQKSRGSDAQKNI